MFEKEHGIVVADRLCKQPFGVGGRRRQDDFETRHRRHHRIDGLAVLRRCVEPAAIDQTDRHGAFRLSAEHIAELGDLVPDLIHADTDEIGKHQFGDRTLARERGTGSGADDCAFGNRRVDNAV